MWNYQANMADLAILALHHHNIVRLFNIVHDIQERPKRRESITCRRLGPLAREVFKA